MTKSLLEYYGFRDQPFGVTPDPGSIYLSRTHREALASLFHGIRADRGFLALIAEPGMGKTTLLFRLLEQLRGFARVAFLFQTQCNSLELFRYLVSQLGLDVRGKDLVEMHLELNQALLREMLAGQRFVLIIDEAQNLADDVLETVRLISNFETPKAKLLQIVLAGQPQLADKLLRPGLEQLRQRVAVIGRLEPLSYLDVIGYIGDRLNAVGYRGGPLFTSSALSMIAKHSRGIPRNINMLCFNSLSLGCALKRKLIDADIVSEAVADLDLRLLGARRVAAHKPVSIRNPRPSIRKPVKQKRVPAWIFRAAVLVAGVILSGPLVPAGRWTERMSSVPSVQSAGAIYSAAVSPDPQPEATAPAPPVAFQTTGQTPIENESPGFQFVVVGPQDTIYEICRKYLGRADPELVQEILNLNPQISHRDQISEGQRVRLPLSAQVVSQPIVRTDLSSDSRENRP